MFYYSLENMFKIHLNSYKLTVHYHHQSLHDHLLLEKDNFEGLV